MSHSPDADRLVAEAQRIAAQVVVAIIQRAFPQGRSDWMSERAAVQAAEPHILSALQQAQAPDPSIAMIHQQLDAAGIPRCENVSLRVEEALARLKGELDAANQHVKILQQQREQAQPRPEIETLKQKMLDLSARMRANRYEIHADCCDDTDNAVPCVSPVCAIEYESEVLLTEAANQLAGAPRERGEWAQDSECGYVAFTCPSCRGVTHWRSDVRVSPQCVGCGAPLPAPPAPSPDGRTE